MAVGDMHYKFIDKDGQTQEIDIPAKVLRSGKREGLSNRETMMRYCAEQGFNVDAPAAKSKSKRKVTRKPDEQKQSIINVLANAMEEQGNVEINVINPERQFQITLDNELYEITLVKKRKPKN